MPKVKANNITINYDQQGTGDPLILIPYLAADYACYAFQVKDCTFLVFRLVILALALANTSDVMAQQVKSTEPDWSFNATIIEACSCPMFCQCYFNTKPAAHSAHGSHSAEMEHYCRFNRAFQVNKGSFGTTK